MTVNQWKRSRSQGIGHGAEPKLIAQSSAYPSYGYSGYGYSGYGYAPAYYGGGYGYSGYGYANPFYGRRFYAYGGGPYIRRHWVHRHYHY